MKYAKMIAKCEKQKVFSGVFRVTFFVFRASFFTSHFTTRSAFTQKVNEFCGLFFRGINKTRNLYDIRKVYSEYFIFRGAFRKNIREIPVKCEIRKVYSRPYCSSNINAP